MTEQKQNEGQRNHKKRKKNLVPWMIILVLMVVIGVGAGMYYRMMNSRETLSRLERDQLALGGMLPGKTPEEIEDLLGAKIEEGMVNIGIAAQPVFEQNGKKGRLGIENIASNRYSFRVTLRLSESDEILYESGLIEPGYYVEFVELRRSLQAGDYPATAVFETYSLDETEDKIAETHVQLVLRVTDVVIYR